MYVQGAAASLAPQLTDLGGTFQQLTVEWFGVSATDALVLMDGSSILVVGKAVAPNHVASTPACLNLPNLCPMLL